MMNRDMQIAEAVQKATEDRFYGRDIPSLEAIIASIPAPEPAAEINQRLLDALRVALIVIEGALYCGHVLNTNGVEKVQAIRTTIAAAEKEIK